MVKLDQAGESSVITLSLIAMTCLFFIALIFGLWAFAGRQNYKNNGVTSINAAVAAAQKQQMATDVAQAAQVEKSPLTTYLGPEVYGSIIVNYPKTWSGYVDSTGTGSALVDGYFAPGVVPAISSTTSVFALRVQVINQPYAQILQSFQGQQQNGQLTVNAYALPKVPTSVGIEVNGQISGQGASTTMVVLPIRADTLEISTQGSQYLSDFNNFVLPNFSFSP
jgi:hypothetical protein